MAASAGELRGGLVPPWLIVLPFMLTMAGFVVVIYGLAVGGAEGLLRVAPLAITLLYLGGVTGALVLYKLFRVRRASWGAASRLYRGVAEYLSRLGLRDIEVVELGRAASRLGEARDGSERVALVSALFPPALFYALYRFHREAYEEELREAEVLTRLAAITAKHGVPVEIDVRKRFTPASPAMVAAGLATAGAAGLVWSYSLARSLNEKMLDRMRLERELVRLLETLRVEARA